MKFFVFSSLAFFAWNLSAAEPVSEVAPASDSPEKKTIENWGWTVAHEQNVSGIELNDAELATFLRGAAANAEGKPAPAELTAIFPDVERVAEARRQKMKHALEQKNVAASQAFFAVLEKKPGVVALASGLHFEVIKPGVGDAPKPEQTITVHFTGHQLDGSEFVQMGPYDVVLVPNRMNTGLFEGAQKIRRGGVIRLYVPAPLAQGEEARLGIPPGSAVIYDLELLEIKATSAEELANSLLPPAPEPPAPAPSGFSESLILETWGWIVARKTGIAAFAFDEASRAAWLRGLAAGIRGEPLAAEIGNAPPAVAHFVAEQRSHVRQATHQKRVAEMNELFATLRENPRVVELPDGLRYEIVQPGVAPYPKTGQIVVVDYAGRLVDGTVFDRTDNEPLHVEVGSVIPGWNEGIQKIGKGGRIKLYVPPSLGYGDENASGVISSIPAESVLIYEIQLLDLQPAAAESPAPADGKRARGD